MCRSPLAALFFLAACSRSGDSPRPAARPAPPPAVARCVPVAGCNLFAGCARVGERIEAYEDHPSLVGRPADVGEVCWAEPETRGCAEALRPGLPCTATPLRQMPLSYACVLEGDRCVARGPRVEAVRSGGREVSIAIVNEMPRPLRVRRAIGVERWDGRWTAQDGTSLLCFLDRCEDIDAPGTECIEIAAGARRASVPWNGMFGDVQCACEECGPVPAGRYRLRVARCDGLADLTAEVSLP